MENLPTSNTQEELIQDIDDFTDEDIKRILAEKEFIKKTGPLTADDFEIIRTYAKGRAPKDGSHISAEELIRFAFIKRMMNEGILTLEDLTPEAAFEYMVNSIRT